MRSGSNVAYVIAAGSALLGAVFFVASRLYGSSSHDSEVCYAMKRDMLDADCFSGNSSMSITCNLAEQTLDYFINVVNTSCVNGSGIIDDAFADINQNITEALNFGDDFFAGMGMFSGIFAAGGCLSTLFKRCKSAPTATPETPLNKVTVSEAKTEILVSPAIVPTIAAPSTSSSSSPKLCGWMSGRATTKLTDKSPLIETPKGTKVELSKFSLCG